MRCLRSDKATRLPTRNQVKPLATRCDRAGRGPIRWTSVPSTGRSACAAPRRRRKRDPAHGHGPSAMAQRGEVLERLRHPTEAVPRDLPTLVRTVIGVAVVIPGLFLISALVALLALLRAPRRLIDRC